jgi:hypothetical protein
MRILLKIPPFKFLIHLLFMSYLKAVCDNDLKKEALILAIKTSKMPPEHIQALKMLAWNMREK